MIRTLVIVKIELKWLCDSQLSFDGSRGKDPLGGQGQRQFQEKPCGDIDLCLSTIVTGSGRGTDSVYNMG